jgi:hypothetical protein
MATNTENNSRFSKHKGNPMATESKPAFRIAPKSPEQLGDLFLDVAMHVFAAQSPGPGQESAEHALDDAFRRAARFVERAITLQARLTATSADTTIDPEHGTRPAETEAAKSALESIADAGIIR